MSTTHPAPSTFRPLPAGRLVCWNVTGGQAQRTVEVLPAEVLARDTVTTELVDAGWRLAEFPNTGCRVLVRPTGFTRHLAAWSAEVQLVDVHDVETGVEQGAVVAQLGAHRRTAFARL